MISKQKMIGKCGLLFSFVMMDLAEGLPKKQASSAT
jgi:hypothetical protein